MSRVWNCYDRSGIAEFIMSTNDGPDRSRRNKSRADNKRQKPLLTIDHRR